MPADEAAIDFAAEIQQGAELTDPRYRLLEMIRAFTVQRFRRSGELDPTHARHLEWCQSLAEAEREAWATGAASRPDSEWLDAERDWTLNATTRFRQRL